MERDDQALFNVCPLNLTGVLYKHIHVHWSGIDEYWFIACQVKPSNISSYKKCSSTCKSSYSWLLGSRDRDQGGAHFSGVGWGLGIFRHPCMYVAANSVTDTHTHTHTHTKRLP